MGLLNKSIDSITDKEIYETLIELQSALIIKRTELRSTLEQKNDFGMNHLALTNEISTLKKNLNVLKLFSESAK